MADVLGVILDSHGGLTSRATVFTFVFVLSLFLIFLLGFALRDVLQKRGLRLRESARAIRPPGRK